LLRPDHVANRNWRGMLGAAAGEFQLEWQWRADAWQSEI
jgi:hypothetical protein